MLVKELVQLCSELYQKTNLGQNWLYLLSITVAPFPVLINFAATEMFMLMQGKKAGASIQSGYTTYFGGNASLRY